MNDLRWQSGKFFEHALKSVTERLQNMSMTKVISRVVSNIIFNSRVILQSILHFWRRFLRLFFPTPWGPPVLGPSSGRQSKPGSWGVPSGAMLGGRLVDSPSGSHDLAKSGAFEALKTTPSWPRMSGHPRNEPPKSEVAGL